ncbi:MAG: recombination mediator RecR [bacterium]
MRSVLPRAVRELAEELTRLPGIGPKTAKRLSIHLLRQPRSVVSRMGDKLKNLHANVRICQRCYNLAEREVCEVCRDETRVASLVCVVESPLDVEAIERTDSYHGLYHVLGGVLSPLEGIGSEQLTMEELFKRIDQENIKEVILALNPTMEGEATARHIVRGLSGKKLSTTRLGRGLPTGGDIEFADATTLAAAFTGRTSL